MTIDTFGCPKCAVRLRRSAALTAGQLVRCPRCSNEFEVPPEEQQRQPGSPPPPPPSSREEPRGRYAPERFRHDEARGREDDEDDRPRRRGRREEEDDEDRPSRRVAYDDDDDDDAYPGRRRGRGESLDAGYRVDIGDWFGLATGHWGIILGPFLGYMLLCGLILFGISMVLIVPMAIAFQAGRVPPEIRALVIIPVIMLMSVILAPPLMAGALIVPLAQLRGKSWSFGDFFSGFAHMGNLIIYSLINFVLTLVCFSPYFVCLGTILANRFTPRHELFFPLLLSGYAVSIGLSLVLQVRISHFALPLILDKKYGPIEAIAGAWKLSSGHSLGLFGFLILCGLIQVLGAMVCYVGLLFSTSLFCLLWAASYLRAINAEVERPGQRRRRRRRYDDEDDF